MTVISSSQSFTRALHQSSLHKHNTLAPPSHVQQVARFQPKHPPRSQVQRETVRKAFLLEAIANLCSFPLVTNTRTVLSLLLLNPAHINPSTILFARLFGGIVIGGLTPPLLAGATNTKNGIESRRVVYLLLGVGELLLIPLLLLEGSKQGHAAALSPRAAYGAIMLLAPPLLWRLYILFVRPDMLGRYTEPKRE
ncbi:hypothetical protein IAU60_001201 [Kwoniella sp. DSM 27419]